MFEKPVRLPLSFAIIAEQAVALPSWFSVLNGRLPICMPRAGQKRRSHLDTKSHKHSRVPGLKFQIELRAPIAQVSAASSHSA
jgi:hypothetical protein